MNGVGSIGRYAIKSFFIFNFHLYFIHYCSLCVCNLFIRATNRGRWPDVRSVASLLPCNSLRYVLKLSTKNGVMHYVLKHR